MSSFKEIVTKAVIGKAKKSSSNSFSLTPEEMPNTVLGCWVINHKFSGTNNANGSVLVTGSFDVNVWYSYNNDKSTAVTTKNFSYSDTMNIPLKDDHDITDSSEIIVRCLHQPTVANVSVDGANVNLEIEKEMGVEIVGDTKVKISVEDTFDDYDEIYDEVDDDVLNEIDENYLNETAN